MRLIQERKKERVRCLDFKETSKGNQIYRFKDNCWVYDFMKFTTKCAPKWYIVHDIACIKWRSCHLQYQFGSHWLLMRVTVGQCLYGHS